MSELDRLPIPEAARLLGVRGRGFVTFAPGAGITFDGFDVDAAGYAGWPGDVIVEVLVREMRAHADRARPAHFAPPERDAEGALRRMTEAYLAAVAAPKE